MKKEPSRERARTLLVVLFVIYLALLTWIVLWKLEVPWFGMGGLRGIGLIPFGDGFANTTASLVEVVANLLLFVPFGIYLGLLAPSRSWWKIAGTFAGASLCFEIAQYVLATGRSDVTDVIVNVTGGLAGLGVLALTHRTLGDRTVAIVTRVCVVGTVLAVLASGIFFVSPLHYAQHEVAASLISSLGGVER